MKRLPRLHVLTTREILERPDFLRTAVTLLAAGGTALHLRAREPAGRLLLERARELRRLVPRTPLLVNDRVDVARIVETGAHLPEAGLTPVQARTILGVGLLLGRSVHRLPQSSDAAEERGEALLDYVFYGHVYETASKPGLPPRGPEGLARAVRGYAALGLPVIAVGGIQPDRVGEVLAAGAHGIAAISGIWDAPDPAEAAGRYLSALAAGSEARVRDETFAVGAAELHRRAKES